MAKTPSYAKTLGLVSGIGFQFVAAVSLGLGLGIWLDRLLGTGVVMTLLGVVLGMVASGMVVHRLLKVLGANAQADASDDVAREETEGRDD